MTPTATIIISAWCAQAFIHRAIASVRAQTLADWECFIVDDASTDATVAAARAACGDDPRFHVVESPVNRGPAAARNVALNQSRGRWICILDADDAMTPDRLARLIDEAEVSGVDILLDDMACSSDPDAPAAARTPLLSLAAPERIDLAAYVEANRIGRGARALGYLKPILARAFIERTGLRYDESLRIAEDFTFLADALALGASMRLTPAPLYLYWVRDGSLSRQPKVSDVTAQLAADTAFRERNAALIDRATRGALDRRRADLEDLRAYLVFKESVLARNWGNAAQIVRRPWALRFVAGAIRHRLRRRS